MLSVWILDVRDVRRPLFQDNDFHGGCLDNSSSSSGVLWAVQVTNGSHQHRTQFLPLPTGQGEGEKVNTDITRSPVHASVLLLTKELVFDLKRYEKQSPDKEHA